MMLHARHITKRFGGVMALDDCSVFVQGPGIFSLIGPNGAGKSTLFDVMSGFVKPDTGKVWFKGVDISDTTAEERVHLGIVRTFQLVRIFPSMSVLDNVVLAKKQYGEKVGFALFRRKKVREEEDALRKRGLEMLAFVGLESKAESLAQELSFGETKLLEIARAMMLDAEVLLLDEPVAGLSPMLRENMKIILQSLARSGRLVFLIEHDMKFVMDISRQLIVLDRGKDVVSGFSEDVLKDKRVLDVYLGRGNAEA